ncbi:reverse transcriptase [Gossypium australe]|uniref:Reverse transcriptase n=1 Tax=Gossypium australe TaxID=47621 RepID=A0A5B6VLL6_9ROSI|nr:reverse transcriptase [Gossypium australe]
MDRIQAHALKEKYYGSSEFLKAELGSQPLAIWRSIWAAKGLLLKGSSWQVGNGKSILVWNVAWFPGDRPYIISLPRVNKVIFLAELIDEQSGKWKKSVVSTTFSEQEFRRILSIPLVQYDLSDRLRWCHEKFREYTVCNGYRLLLRGFLGTENDLYNDIGPKKQIFYKQLWQTNVI